jgi:hypothetical protein
MYERKVLENCQKSLEKGNACATGIGIFAAVLFEGKILLRKRTDKNSMFGADLSSKYELVGGAVGVDELNCQAQGCEYQGMVIDTLGRNLNLKAGLDYQFSPQEGMQLVLLPAFLAKSDMIDLAFVCPIPFSDIKETEEFKSAIRDGSLGFFSREEVSKIEVISKRMLFMIEEAFHYSEVHEL